MAQVLLQRPHIIVSVVGVPEAHADLNEYKGDEDEDMNDLEACHMSPGESKEDHANFHEI